MRVASILRAVFNAMFILYGQQTRTTTEEPCWRTLPLTPARKCALKKVGQLVRSVLLSTPGPLTVVQLRRDYVDLVGNDVPYREFGLPSVISFLCMLRDICLVVERRDLDSCADPHDPEEVMLVHPLVEERNDYMRALVLANRRNN
ncbi:hypothetical protein ABEB36_010699 [Hypothenemus hampei]|uniref:HTH OST-type domain-containing protein n=1 Tax=Hypothenemus hampei TaxID=57062 RepID=A0ABD1ECR5_HYPHA